MAYHLAFLNYLPFETVPAKSARGSHGSAEGRHRGVLVAYEQACRKVRLAKEAAAAEKASSVMTADTEMITDAEERLRAEQAKQAEQREKADQERRRQAVPGLLDAMWSMLDLKAAVRESDMEYVLRPSSAAETVDQNKTIADLAVTLKDIATGMRDSGKVTSGTGPKLVEIAKDAGEIADLQTFEAIKDAAGFIRDNANTLYSYIGTPAKNKSGGKKSLNDKKLDPALKDSADAAADTTERSKRAPERAARILAVVLRRHVRALAAAYPNSITDTGLLKGKSADVTWARLMTWLATSEFKEELPGSADALGKLEKLFVADFGTAPITVGDDAWVDDAGNSGLVVTWNTGTSKMEINGRAAAPDGVAGMGSHTTAWIVECDALNAIIAEATSAAERIAALSGAVEDDLAGEVIRLDELLPADQLEGSQLRELFQAAVDVLTAKNPEEAAHSYLEFRNLLPFATVDEGDRGGHAEGTNTTLGGRFDEEALEVATSNVADALKDIRRIKALSVVLETSAKQLRIDAKRTDKNKKKRWPPQVEKAALASAVRLAKRAKKLSKLVADNEIDVAAADMAARRIHDVRWSEHKVVFGQAYS
jgi:hypothetical protein